MRRSNNIFLYLKKNSDFWLYCFKLLNTIRSTAFPENLARKTKRTNESTTRRPTGRPTVAFGADCVGDVALVLGGCMPNTAVP